MKTSQKQISHLQQLRKYLSKNFERDAQVILVGLGCLFALQILTNTLPLYFIYYYHIPMFFPFLHPGKYGATSMYVWVGYLISGIIIGRIVKKFPVLFAVGVGFIFAILYVAFLEYLLPPSVYLYQVFPVQVLIAIIILTGIGGLIGKGLQRK